MSQKQYWKGLEELQGSANQEKLANEFQEPLAFDMSDDLLNATTPRRDFLKFLGFSTLAATLAASCEMPVRKAIPYAIKPEDITPGVPNYYASTFNDNGDYCAIVIKTRDGRPIKIEGNELSSVTRGATTARVQASVLNLYDKTRMRFPHANGQEATYDAIDRQVKEALAANAGKPAYLLTGSILSPTTKDIISQFTAKYPNVKHVVYDPISYSGMLLANEASYGKRTLPSYHFDKAQTIVSLGADFLGTWLSPAEFAKGYAAGRRVSAKNPKMSKHYQVESMHTISGASADHRVTCKPSEIGAVAVALYNAVTGGASSMSGKLGEMITKAAADLKKGNGLVVCGSNDVAVQTVVNAINDKIGANGTTINWAVTSNYRQGIDADIVALTEAMNAGNVGAVLIHGVNPVYEYHDGKKFADGLSKVPLTVSFADRMDETAQKCKFVTPDHNFLESWGDAEPKTGYYSLQQPGIAPLFKTRAFQDSLLTWAGATSTYGDYWKNYWMTKMGSQENFDRALQIGVVEPAGEMAMGGASFAGNIADAMAKATANKGGDVEMVVYQKISMGHGGVWSNNPWLQEMPDPITKATWDNYVCVSPDRAKKLDAELNGQNEVVTKKRVARIKVAGAPELLLPIVVVPGMPDNVIAVAVGYGRDAKVGRAAASSDAANDRKGGKNAYPYVTYNGQTFQYSVPASIEKTDEMYDVAITQTHHSYEHRPVVREYTLEEFSKDPQVLIKERREELKEFVVAPWQEGAEEEAEKMNSEELEKNFRQNGTLYPQYEHLGIHWGMSVDLNTCIGCGACTMACQAENNVSVVGKAHVLKVHEMHWLRIDRYFSGNPADPDSIQTVFQPMLCQHCDNAPCENVCPVDATNHSSEGINQMAYNRCIGTKYCANNCPYKVRRFNWLDWNGADCFDDNLYEDYRRDDMNDDLTRMVLNPDVTVRSRGVMEKCSFCVQRLQDAKLTAKKENRPVRDGEARTACQQSCPTNAITFGNMNDKSSALYKIRREENAERTFYVLEDVHTLPNVNYLAKVRNTDEIVSGTKEDVLMEKHI
ncbi:MAG: TAT-variant-translocated molybdopterin oxidoreductase [Bacteroidetes bacterium]|nr:TAT-variant-translocated molybdopterin oxidoreductase [Bacteroidota bacterium]